VNEQSAKVKIDAIQEIVRIIARSEAEKVVEAAIVTAPSPSLRERVTEIERQMSELRADPNPVTAAPTPYIRVLPFGDPGRDLPVGTVADYVCGGHPPMRVRVTKTQEMWRRDRGDVSTPYDGDMGILSIISIPDAKTPRDIEGMSVDDCRIEVGPPSVPGYAVPNTPEEMQKLPKVWRFEYMEHCSQGGFYVRAISRSGKTCHAYATERDLAEWRLRVACERASNK
jgi:hypothetical protein